MLKNYFSGAHFILTEKCNLRCPYCYVEKKNTEMDFDTAERGIKFLINGAIKNKEHRISITFFGGAPTLKLDLMNFIFDTTLSLCQKCELELQYEMKPSFTLITNCMIYNDELEQFLIKWKTILGTVNIQLSLDGDPDTQRLTRPAYNNAFDSGEKMVSNVAKYKAFADKYHVDYGTEIYVHSVISKDNLKDFAKNYKYFSNLGFYGFWHCLVVEDDWNEEDQKLYKQQLDEIYDFNIALGEQGILSFLYNKTFMNRDSVFCTAGKTLCAIGPDGQVFGCHRMFEADPTSAIGSVNKDGHFWVDPEKKAFFDNLTDEDCYGDMPCKQCHSQGCYRCIASNMKYNLLPNICFPKYCDMARIEAEFRAKVETYLRSINRYPEDTKFSKSKINDNSNYSDLINTLDTVRQLIGTEFLDIEERLGIIEDKQQAMIDLLVGLLLKFEESRDFRNDQ